MVKASIIVAVDSLTVLAFTTITFLSVICAYPRMLGANGAYVCLGQSMEPTIMLGDMVLTKPVEPSQVKVGDIIIFRYEDSLVVHRVIEESDGSFRTKGDNSEAADPWIVPPKALLGRFWVRIPYFGYVVAFVKSRYFLLFVSLPVGVYLIATRTWDTYELLTHARESAETVARKTRESYWWLRRLVDAYYFRGVWWRSVLLGPGAR